MWTFRWLVAASRSAATVILSDGGSVSLAISIVGFVIEGVSFGAKL